MHVRWHVAPQQPEAQRTLSRALGIHPLVAQLLLNRGVNEPTAAAAYLAADLNGLHDPFLLRDMERAIHRLQDAIARRERILVFGDYDVDGVTATAVVVSALRARGADVCSLLPHRLEDGYGPSDKLIETARAQGAKLVITLDCGTTAVREIAALKALGIETIILDHHTPRADALPPAHTMINPWHPECPYPHKGLASVGLAFKLVQALFRHEPSEWQRHLDLAALGTVADVVPLVDENRILVKHGLAHLAKTRRVGLQSLMDVAGMNSEAIRPFHIGFILGPRINASGRLGSAERALQLLLTDSSDEAEALAQELDQDNRERQRLETQALNEALREVEQSVDFTQTRVLVVAKDGWHPGVVGIVAARLVDRYYRPAIVVAFEGERGRGSGRSIPGFDITAAVTACAAHLEAFGGHPAACGLTVQRRQFEAFRQALNREVMRTLPADRLIPAFHIDAEITLASLDEALVQGLEQLQPYGQGNPEPLFLSRGLAIRGPTRRVGRNHLKLLVSDGAVTCEAMGFGMGERAGEFGDGTRLDAVYTPTLNTWDGLQTIQLTLKDVRLI